MREKKKRPDARKQSDRQRMTEIKRQLNSRKIKKENQELLFKFDRNHKGITFDDAGAILIFVHWLEDGDYQLVHEKTVFCVPFSHMVSSRDLK